MDDSKLIYELHEFDFDQMNMILACEAEEFLLIVQMKWINLLECIRHDTNVLTETMLVFRRVNFHYIQILEHS